MRLSSADIDLHQISDSHSHVSWQIEFDIFVVWCVKQDAVGMSKKSIESVESGIFFKVDARYLSRIFACLEDSLQDYWKQKFFFPNSDKRSEAI